MTTIDGAEPAQATSSARSTSPETRLIGRALVVDDHAESRAAIAHALRTAGCTVEEVAQPSAVLGRLEAFQPDVVITDVCMPEIGGFALAEQIRAHDPLLPVVMVSGFATVPEAVRAMSEGALHYLAKPIDHAELIGVIRRALALQRARRTGVSSARNGRRANDPFAALVGESAEMRALLARARLLAAQSKPVLIVGEPGSGKDRLADALHAADGSSRGALVRVAGSSTTAAELEARARQGGGTLVVGDVADLDGAAQAALSAVIDGANEGRGPRVIALTSADLDGRVASGAFRDALYRRLATDVLYVPPLRDRRGDVPLLAEHTVARLATEHNAPAARLEPSAMQLLQAHDWPGNVRELEGVLRDALALARGGPITAASVQPWLARRTRPFTPRVPGATFAEIERFAILATYESCGHNALRTADILGLSPRTVHYRLREYRGDVGRRTRARR